MKKATVLYNEEARLKELYDYEILDTTREKIFDDITDLARTICGTKISVISLVDLDRQWFKSVQGLEVSETPRDVSYCGHAITQNEIFEIQDARLDERFADNPLCVGAPHVIFYAGAPLITPNGHKIGTLCVIDDQPKKLTTTQRQVLLQLAKQVMSYLELHKKETELQLSHLKLDRIVNHIPVMISMYNEKGEFMWCNKGWERELGWKAEEMSGKDILSEFYPDPQKRQEVLDFMMKPNSGWKDFYTRVKDGSFIHTSWANVSLPNGWSIGIGKNINERVKNEREKEVLYQRNRDILRAAGLGSWDWWLESNKVVFDELWFEMLGLKSDESLMNLSTWQERVHPDDLEQCFKDIQKHLSGETEFYENIHRMKHKDGHWVYILDRGRISERDKTGKPVRFTGTHFDITNQKKIEQSLIEFKKKTEAVYEASHDAILLWDNGYLIDTNARGLQLFGFESVEEMRSIHPADLSPVLQPNGRNSKEWADELIKKLETQDNIRFEWVHKKKDGTDFECDIVTSSFSLDGKRITQSTIRDISHERIEQRRNLSFYNTLLEINQLPQHLTFKERIDLTIKCVSQVLDCEQVSYWDYLEDPKAIQCLSLFNKKTQTFQSGFKLVSQGSESYFSSIDKDASVIAHNVETHPATRDLLESYLVPHGVTSMMDQVLKEDGKVVGVLCLEHKGEPREWSVNEQAFSRAVADIISIILKDLKLLKNKKVLEDVESMAKIGGWEYHPASDKLSWTDETFRIHEMPITEKVDVEQAIAFYMEEDQRRISIDFLNCLKDGVPFQNEYQIKSTSGKMKWVRSRGEAIRSSTGEIELVRGIFQDITEIKKRELELSLTRDRLKRVVDSSPTVIYECQVKDGNFLTTYFSDQVLELTGYQASEFLKPDGLKFGDLVVVEDRQQCLDNLAFALRSNGEYEHRYRIKRADGVIRWVLERGKIDAKTGLMNGVLLDVSHEVSLVHNLNTTKRALDETAIIAITDPQGRITYVNKKFEEVSGYHSHEVVGQTHRIVKSGYHSDQFFKNLWEVITLGRVWKGVIKNKNKLGEFYYVDTTIHPIKNENDEIIEFLSVRYDVTKKVRTDKVNSFISSLRATFIELSEDPQAFYPKVLELLLTLCESEFGFLGEILEDKAGSYLKTFAITDISWSPEIKKFYDEHKTKGFEFRNLGTLFGYSIKTSKTLISNDPSSDPRSFGLPIGHPKLNSFACFPVSLGSQKRLLIGVANRANGYFDGYEDFISPALIALGEMVEAMNLKQSLKVQTLISEHSAKLASIGQLAAGVGHEINNPLAVIKGIVMMATEELSESGQLTDSVKQKFSKIDTSIDRIANIVKGLKTFSRSGQMELDYFDLRNVLEEVQGLFVEIYQRAGIKLEFEFDPTKTYPIYGNRGRIQQVLVNLISNAKDAMEDVSTPVLRVRMHRQGQDVKLEVSDNGKGIPPEIRQKIFDPFFTTKDVNKGTGIGLSLVMTIINEHGGDIDLESKQGVGTTFYVSLPAKESMEKVADVTTTQTVTVVKQKLKALVVDDEEDLRDILAQILERMGFEVTMACDGVQALDAIHKNGCDLVVSDSKMPNMTGMELLAEVRKIKSHKPMKFVLVSGDLSLVEYFSDEQMKPDDILIKPFRIDVIKTKIASLFPQLKEDT